MEGTNFFIHVSELSFQSLNSGLGALYGPLIPHMLPDSVHRRSSINLWVITMTGLLRPGLQLEFNTQHLLIPKKISLSTAIF